MSSALIALLFSTFLSGCGVVHLHDEPKASASQSALEEYAKIDLQAGIKIRRANQLKLESDYLAAIDRRGLAVADNLLVQVMGDEYADNSLRALALDGPFNVRGFLEQIGIKCLKVPSDEDRKSACKKEHSVEGFQSAVKVLTTEQSQYSSLTKQFSKSFNTATKTLGQTLNCLYDANKSATDCAKTPKAARAAGTEDDTESEADSTLPKQLITLSFTPVACLAVDVPAQNVPDYLLYDFKKNRPSNISDSAYAAIQPKLDLMASAYKKFNDNIRKTYPEHATHCRNKVLPARDAVPAENLIQPLTEDMAAAAEYQKQVAKAKTHLNSVVTKYNQKSATFGLAKKKDGTEAKDELEEILKDLQSAVKNLNKVSGFAGIEIASEQQVKAIDGAIETILTGSVPDGNLEDKPAFRKFVAIAGSVNSLRKRFTELTKAQATTALAPLMVQRDISQAKLKWARARVAIQQKRIDIRINRLLAIAGAEQGNRSVLTLYQFAFRQLNSFAGGSDIYDVIFDNGDAGEWNKPGSMKSFLEEIDKGNISETQANYLIRGIVALAIAYKLEQSSLEATSVQLKFLKSHEALAKSEMALVMWDAIIRGPLTLISAYHQTGIKPKELAQLITIAAGFAGIGLGK